MVRQSFGGLVDGRQIKAARAALGITQAELAELAGLHPKAIGYYEAQSPLSRHLVMIVRVKAALSAMGLESESVPLPAVVIGSSVSAP